MAEDVVVLFVGADADAVQLSELIGLTGDALRVTRVASWRAFDSIASGWDVVVAGGPSAPTTIDEVRAHVPAAFATPVLAVVHAVHGRLPVGDGRIEWFRTDEFARLIPVLRAVRRAVLAEDRASHLQESTAILEQQARQTGRLRVLGQMSAGVAHEFNNILTIINGYGEQVLARSAGQPHIEKVATSLMQGVGRGVDLSQRLLSFSRTQQSDIGDASLSAVLREAEGLLRPLLGERVVMLSRIEPGLPRVKGDASALIEVITNLAVNARDAMPDGGTLTVQAASLPVDQGAPQVLLTVRDTGTGMDAETLDRACEPFFTTKRQGSGTGLGLSLVREIVEQAGGTFALSSRVGVGTTVSLTLEASGVDAPMPSAERQEPAASMGFETVLLVEDDAAVREIVVEFLRSASYYVIEAADSAEALAVVRRDRPKVDLLVSDIVLPGLSGPELAGALRQFAPQMRTLFISGYPSDAVGAARHATFVAKPFSRAGLLQAVRKALVAPRFREIDGSDGFGRLANSEGDVAQGQGHGGSH